MPARCEQAAIALVCVGLALAAVGRGLSGAVPKGARDRPGLEDILVALLAA